MSTSVAHSFCPYKGLQPYTEADRKYFFGRTRDQGIIISNLYASPLTVFYGASGVGKSSVLLAGVVPLLKQEPRDVVVVVFNSWQGEDFLAALKSEVAKQAGTTAPVAEALPLDDFLAETQRALGLPLFLILDQFEEYFLYHPSSPAADAFESSLARAVNRRSVQVNIFLSLREDGLSKLDRFQGRLPALLNNLLRLGHLDRDSAREAIVKPLEQYNSESGAGQLPFTIEDALVNAVLDDLSSVTTASDQVGQGQVVEQSKSAGTVPIETPFLQMVLTRLWDEETAGGSRVLRLQTYDALGRAENIARTHLDTMMSRLTDLERATGANILRYLVTPSGTKIAQEAGALASWSELPPAEVQSFLDRLSAPDMRILRTVQAPGQPARYQIFHDVLAHAILDWRARYVQEQKRLEAEHQLALERASSAEQLAHQRKRTRRLRLIAAGLLLMLLSMIVLAGKVYYANFTARSGELAASSKAQLDTDPELSLLLAIEAVNTRRTKKSIEALKAALIASQLNAVLDAKTEGRVASVAFSPDGKHVVTASWDGAARVWETKTHNILSVLAGHGNHVNSAAFSPDGRYVLTTSQDNTARVWDGWQAGAPKIIQKLSEGGEISTAAFSPNGEYILTAGGEGKVHVWTWKGDAPEEKAQLDIALALAGNASATQPSTVPATPEPSPTPSSAATPGVPAASATPGRIFIYKAAFSPDPDGNYIIVASKTRKVLVWQWRDEKNNQVKLKLSGHTSGVYDAAFSNDGAYAVTGSDDSTAIVWDLKKPDVPKVKFNLGTNRIRGVAFSPDGNFVATASYDRLARLWEWQQFDAVLRAAQKPEERSQPMILSGHSGLVICVAYSADGQFVVTGSDDGTARVWRTQRLDRGTLDKLSTDELLQLARGRVTRELTHAEKDL
ncbi:MAG: hypothetical protein JWM21_992 [Acidobacteria bacterium]|nr:hypothetical protein [Acidobacteriota bacterium]